MLTGVVGANAEVKKIDTAKVINFSVACKYGKETTWYDCAYWRNADDECKVAQYIQKGIRVAVTGRPTVRAYKTKEGDVRAVLGVNVERVELLTRNDDAENDPF